ncbi:2,3-bisphosphoglycerate-independent phosphoglycerate mutase [Neisseria sp. Ec49-e6-T10]|uniref:2,3-bisphosphoglycerate-independent phosphoglycerate mutase n=1 Tax=Neisseria sp. Ec49-e6-T10 TaxID=3140744 RepID=UPI003EB80F6E
MQLKKQVILLILDGFGHREEKENNAVALANTPHLDKLKQQYPYNTINASERNVGLPQGQFGNSEVGHLNIGAGRVVEQDITRIDSAIEQHQFAHNPTLQSAFSKIQANQSLHLLGLFSDGGVHSHMAHFFATLDAAIAFGLKSIVVHPFLDGRDTPPQSAEPYLTTLESYIQKHPQVSIGTIMGRFYSMDRDNRWERVEPAYQALVDNKAPFYAQSALEALQMGYERNEHDEFIQPTIIQDGHPIKNGDVVLFLNFRADRARELTSALLSADFSGFNRTKIQLSYFASMTSYGDQFPYPVLFAPNQIKNSFGEYVSSLGLSQLRIAETEKYPHVTYFFSGGHEACYPKEERILVPSPKVKTYDLQPQMSAYEVTDHIVKAVEKHQFDVIICNFANGDMVGHSGVLSAAIAAVETLDECVGRIVDIAKQEGVEVLITADHGNCERMFDHVHDQVHTQHTLDPVPFLYIGRKAHIKSGGALKDIAPSLLAMMGLAKPEEMTGESLIEFDE